MSRKQHWNQIYTKNTPMEVSWFQNEPSLSLQLIQSLPLDKSASIIDVGGGASRLVDHLLEAGYLNLAVLDISNSAIAHAQDRLGQLQDQIEWFVSDVTHFEPTRKFDLWHDRAVFHFLTEETDRQRYIDILDQALVNGGDLIIATFAIGGPQQCSGLDIVQYDKDTMCAELGDKFKLRDVHHELHITPDNKEQAFVYFHFTKDKD